MTRNWTEEQKNLVIQLYTVDKLSCKEIGNRFAAKADTISKYLKSQGIEVHCRPDVNKKMNESYFENIDSSKKAYFLGLIFADGSITNDSQGRAPMFRLELIEDDLDVLLELKRELNIDSALRYSKRKNRKGTYVLSVRSKKLVEDLSKYNIIQNKTYKVDEVVFPKDFLIDFIRGYVDGDGSIYYSGGSWHLNICGHSQSIIQQFQYKIDSLIQKKTHNKITNYAKVYRITWNGKDAQKLCALLYNNADISIARKRNKAMAAQEDKKS